MRRLGGAGRIPGARRWGPWLVLIAVAGGLAYGGWRLWDLWRYRTAVAEVRGLLQAGRDGAAARSLSVILGRYPDSDEIALLLGLCEGRRGRAEQAARALALIPPGSRYAPQAWLARAELMADRGQFAEVERLLDQALGDPRIDGSDLGRYLIRLYALEGRLEEARRLLDTTWEGLNRAGRGRERQAIDLVRLQHSLSEGIATDEEVRDELDRAARLAPEDDRVWLGKANLAIRRNAFGEAEPWLDACLQRRPRDAAVWQARLDWALGLGREPEVWEALRHLPVDPANPAQIHRLTAKLAARRGDTASERRALQRLLEVAPQEAGAIDRLAELETREGQPARAADLRRKKAELPGYDLRYRELLRRNQPVRDAVNLSHLAEQLGRWFEARVFSDLAVSTGQVAAEPQAGLARSDRRRAAGEGPGPTLADALASELKADGDAPRSRSASPTDRGDSATPALPTRPSTIRPG